jgi:hypothetical protein
MPFRFAGFIRSGRNENERIGSTASCEDDQAEGGIRETATENLERTTKDVAKQAGRMEKSGARRTGQPRPGAPGSRPRIGNAADLLLFFTTSALRFTSFFSSPRCAIIRSNRSE